MYSFAQRQACGVWDEPMYGRYLMHSGTNHPGKLQVLEAWPTKLYTIAQQLEQRKEGHREVYLKNMAHHMVGEPWDWAQSSAFVFWIRHPRKVVQSFSKVIQEVKLEDIGVVQQEAQWRAIQEVAGRKIVVDSDEMLASPEQTLPKICAALGIPWDANMLHWPVGPKSYDGPWAPHWYGNVHKTTGFGPPKSMPKPLDPHLEAVVERALPHYLALYHQRLQF